MVWSGKSVAGGIAIGRLSVLGAQEHQVVRYHIEDTEQEIQRFIQARERSVQELEELYAKAVAEVGQVNAMIFQVHQMMLEDLDYSDSVEHMIRGQKVNCEYAVAVTGDNFTRMFQAMDDAYMRERAADVQDVSNRLIQVLQGKTTGFEENADWQQEPVILLAEDLAPSQTVQLDKSRVLAFVTRKGSGNSHTAILARTMNIPALVGVDFPEEIHGRMGIVDSREGILYVDPTQEELEHYWGLLEEQTQQTLLLQELKGKDNVTLDGQSIQVYANIGSVGDVAQVLANDAGGIGLFRSEFLYLENHDYPSEEQQFQAYKTVAENMAGRRVIIRTLDIGADKQADYFGLEKEENPAMGYRAIRICLDRRDVFKTQLRAIYRASAYGQLAIMFPMIISLDEVRQIKGIIREVKQELTETGMFYKDLELGIMIETPAAAMISDLLAKEVDFFSIGTNDLTQYTLAIDRQNPKLDNCYDAHHPAVLRLIEQVVKNGHQAGIWVGICGELAADLTLTETFLRMGIDELSVAATGILPLRRKIRSLDLTR